MCFMKQMTIPTGEEIYYLDKFTAKWVVEEVFIENIYLLHGISIKDGDIVFDVGANMGFFSYHASRQANDLQIYTFEPVPALFEVLEANLVNLPQHIWNYNIGLSDESGIADLHYMPHSSGNSSFNRINVDLMLETTVKNWDELHVIKPKEFPKIPKFLRKFILRPYLKRFYSKGIDIPCRLRTLSDIIAENNIERINLLKIDAENHERQVLQGIIDEDWNKIQQIVMEIHTNPDGCANLNIELTDLLTMKGFTCVQGKKSADTLMGVYMLYARRL